MKQYFVFRAWLFIDSGKFIFDLLSPHDVSNDVRGRDQYFAGMGTIGCCFTW